MRRLSTSMSRLLWTSRKKVMSMAVLSRSVLIVAMVLSCAVLPDFDPGADVLRFDLRMDKDRCFCVAGQSCDKSVDSQFCKRPSSQLFFAGCQEFKGKRYNIVDRLYRLLLPPFTRWDAARFLTLAADPTARSPMTAISCALRQHDTHNEQQHQVIDIFSFPNSSTNVGSCVDIVTPIFEDSERSHPFLPLVPLLIRIIGSTFVHTIPKVFLPPTYEGVLTLAAIVLNFLAFVLAAIFLHELTLVIVLPYETLKRLTRRTKNPCDPCKLRKRMEDWNDVSSVEINDYRTALTLTEQVCFLFCCNPAGVFFTASYSEGTFCALTFLGHLFAAKKRLVLATVPWMAASYTRSNGIMSSVFLAIVGMSKMWSIISAPSSSSATALQGSANANTGWRIGPKLTNIVLATMTLIWHLSLAAIVALPFLYHDWSGYQSHCFFDSSYNEIRPSWCQNAVGKQFSMYSFVQEKHWNIGYFRYYQLKQLPNFLLASPMFAIGSGGALTWIRHSFHRSFSKSASPSSAERRRREHLNVKARVVEGDGTFHDEILSGYGGDFHSDSSIIGGLGRVYYWISAALVESTTTQPLMTRGDKLKREAPDNALLGPHLMAQYTILAGSCVLGAVVAHVQIITRLICSSSPSIYWFMAWLATQPFSNGGNNTTRKRDARTMLLCYCALYNFLGVIMHVNWLPWT